MAFDNFIQCDATSKATGERCKNPAVTGSAKCRHHGGKTPKGANSPHFKHGRYSKYMPEGLLDAYEDAKADPELLSVRQDIALVDTLIAGLLPNLDTGESGKAWAEMRKLVQNAQKAYHNEDMGNMFVAFEDMNGIIDRRLLHYETEKEIRGQIDQRRKLVETEQKISLQGERSLSVEQFMSLMTAVLQVISNVVHDQQQRYAIATEIQRVVGGNDIIARQQRLTDAE